MKCPNCGVELIADTRDMAYLYNGGKTTLAAVSGMFCPGCGESVLGAEESQRVSALMLEFNRMMDSGLQHVY